MASPNSRPPQDNFHSSLIARLPFIVPVEPDSELEEEAPEQEEEEYTLAIAFHQSFIDNPASHGLLIRRNARGAVSCRASAGVLDVDPEERDNVLELPLLYLDPDDFRYEQQLQDQVRGEHEAAEADRRRRERETRPPSTLQWVTVFILIVLLLLANHSLDNTQHPHAKPPPPPTAATDSSLSLPHAPVAGVDVARTAVAGVEKMVRVLLDHLYQPYALHLDIYGTHAYGRREEARGLTVLEQFQRGLIAMCDYLTSEDRVGLAVGRESWVSAEARPACTLATTALSAATEANWLLAAHLTGRGRTDTDDASSFDPALDALAWLANDLRVLANDSTRSSSSSDHNKQARRFADLTEWYLAPPRQDKPPGQLAGVFAVLKDLADTVGGVKSATEVVRDKLLPLAVARNEALEGVVAKLRGRKGSGVRAVVAEVLPYWRLGEGMIKE
ncbi:hypothetical protein CONLIGDRAFT_687879, partial [Coniochaeta ligniaria NRRL 30616]